MKRIMVLALAVALCGFASGCASSGGGSSAGDTSSGSAASTSSASANSAASSSAGLAEGYATVPGVHGGVQYVQDADGAYYELDSKGEPSTAFSFTPESGYEFVGTDMDITLGESVDTDLYSLTFDTAEWADDVVVPSGKTYGNYAEDCQWLIIKGTITNKGPEAVNNTVYNAKGVKIGNTWETGQLFFLSNGDRALELGSGETAEAWLITQIDDGDIAEASNGSFVFEWRIKGANKEVKTGSEKDATRVTATYQIALQ